MVKDKVTGTSRGFGYIKFFQFSHAAKDFEGCNLSYKPKFADPRPSLEDHRAHYGSSTETKLADLRTNQVRGRRDIEEAREGKEHGIKAGDLGMAKRKDTKKRSYVEVMRRSRYQEAPREAGTREESGAGDQGRGGAEGGQV